TPGLGTGRFSVSTLGALDYFYTLLFRHDFRGSSFFSVSITNEVSSLKFRLGQAFWESNDLDARATGLVAESLCNIADHSVFAACLACISLCQSFCCVRKARMLSPTMLKTIT